MNEGLDSEWFETSPQDYLDPKSKPKRLKLLADEQMPQPIIAEIRKAKINISVLTSSQRRAPDASVLQLAEQSGRVLLTLDADFWDDRKHPLHQMRTGVIYVAEAPHQHDR